MSQTGAATVRHWVLPVHCTQVIVVVLQTGVVAVAAHCVLLVHDVTQVPVELHVRPVPHCELIVHWTHV